jgi:hypothetical protein
MLHSNLYIHVADGVALNSDQQDSLVALLGARCRKDTLEKLRRRIACIHLQDQLLQYYGITSRMKVYNTYCQYVPGQDYMAEIRLLRKAILD